MVVVLSVEEAEILNVTPDKVPERFKFVPVALVNVRAPKLEIPETKRFVVVTPIPAIVNPPSIVVETFVEPMWIPPRADKLVPIKTVVVPGPVAMLTVLEVPIPKLSV